MEFHYDVFLRHNSADKPKMRRLAQLLSKAGLRLWFDEWPIKLRDDVYLAIERRLEAATRTAAALRVWGGNTRHARATHE